MIYSANITSDRDTGIGAWTGDQFYRAMHEGVGAHGENLYPALPYVWFSRITRADDDAILAYLKTTPAVSYTPPANQLPFPLNIRFFVGGWNLLFFRPHEFQADPGQSAEWNRGAFLVTGPGHCGACHTPKNFLGADKSNQALRGGDLDNWVAPDLTENTRTGLGRWSVDDIVEFLKTGRNAHAGAGGSMAEVVSYSTSLMSDQDRHAIAVYLKSQAASPGRRIRLAGRRGDEARRGHLLRRLRLVPPGERGRPAAILPAAGPERHAATGRSDRVGTPDPGGQPHRAHGHQPFAADHAELRLEAHRRRDRRRLHLRPQQLGQPGGGRPGLEGPRPARSPRPADRASHRQLRRSGVIR
ncbi:MAG: cytochrome c [Caulobacteraceae bacterium]